MNAVTLPVPYREALYPARLHAVGPGERQAMESAAQSKPWALAKSPQSHPGGDRWSGLHPCREPACAGLSAYASTRRMGMYYRGMIVDLKA